MLILRVVIWETEESWNQRVVQMHLGKAFEIALILMNTFFLQDVICKIA